MRKPSELPLRSDDLQGLRELIHRFGLEIPFDLGRTYHLVLDSSRLVADTHRAVRQSARTHLRELLDSRLIVGFTLDQALEEVPRALIDDIAPHYGIPPAQLMASWDALVSKLVVVPSTDIDPSSDRTDFSGLAQRDATDVPFAMLAAALGAKLFSSDPDIIEQCGSRVLADLEDLRALKLYARDLTAGVGFQATTSTLAIVGVSVSHQVIADVSKAVVRNFDRWGWIVLAAVAAGGLVVAFSPSARAKVREFTRTAGPVVGELAMELFSAWEQSRLLRERAEAMRERLDVVFGPPPTIGQAAYGILLQERNGLPWAQLRTRARDVCGQDIGPEDSGGISHPRIRQSLGKWCIR